MMGMLLVLAFLFQTPVLPGSYVLEISSPGVNLYEQEIEVGVQGLTGLQIEIPFIQLTGRVVAGGGGPLPKLTGALRLISKGRNGRILYVFPDAAGRFSMLLAPGEYRVLTENLGPAVRSISDGSKEFQDQTFVFDRVNKPELLVTVE